MSGETGVETHVETIGNPGFPGNPSEMLSRRWRSYGLSHLPYHLLLLAKMLDRAASATTLRDDGLTLAEWRVMANLRGLGESTVNALADYALVDRAEVSRASRALEERGLVTHGPHPKSKAKKLLWLTESGLALAHEVGEERRNFYAYLTADLDDGMKQQFDDLLLHLAIRLEQYDPAASIGVSV